MTKNTLMAIFAYTQNDNAEQIAYASRLLAYGLNKGFNGLENDKTLGKIVENLGRVASFFHSVKAFKINFFLEELQNGMDYTVNFIAGRKEAFVQGRMPKDAVELVSKIYMNERNPVALLRFALDDKVVERLKRANEFYQSIGMKMVYADALMKY